MAVTTTIADNITQDELATNFSIPITVNDLTGQGVVSFTIDIQYDDTVVDITGATPQDITSGLSFTVNTDFGGTGDTIRISWAGVSALIGSGTLFTIQGDSVGIGSSVLTLENVTYNEGTPSNTSDSGSIDIISRTPSFVLTGVDGVGVIPITPTVGTGTTPTFSFSGVTGNGDNSERYFETFGDRTVSTEHPDWSFLSNPSSETTQQVVTDVGATDGKSFQLQTVATTTRRVVLENDIINKDDIDITYRFKQDDVSTDVEYSFWVRASGGEGTESGYLVVLNSNTGFNLYEANSGSYTLKDTGTTFTRLADTYYRIRIRMIGTTLYARIWEDTDNEPSVWNAEMTDTTHTSGTFGISVSCIAGTYNLDIDTVGVGYDGVVGLFLDKTDLVFKGLTLASTSDGSLRYIDLDDDTSEVIYINNDEITSHAIHTIDEEFYVCSAALNNIVKFDKYGENISTVGTGISVVIGVEIIPSTNKILYQGFNDADLIQRDLPGFDNPVTLRNDTTPGLRIFYSESEDKIYWSTDDGHRRIDSDGTNDTLLLTETNAVSVVSDGTYFWYTSFSTGNVGRRDNDNTNNISVFTGGSEMAFITFKESTEELFFTDHTTDIVHKSDYDGSNLTSYITDIVEPTTVRFFDFISFSETATTPSFSFSSEDGTFVLDDLTVVGGTAEVPFVGVTPSITLGSITKVSTTGVISFTSEDGISNIVSGFGQTAEISFRLPVAVGLLTDVNVSIEFPNNHYENDIFSVDVTTSDTTGQGCVSFQTKILYEATVVSALSVNPIGVLAGESLTVNLTTPGEIVVAWASASPISSSGGLFEMVFQALPVPSGIASSLLTFDNFTWNDDTPTSSTQDSLIIIQDNPGLPPNIVFRGVNGSALFNGITPSFSFNGVLGIPTSTADYGYSFTPSFSFTSEDGVGDLGVITQTGINPIITFVGVDGVVSSGVVVGLGLTPTITFTSEISNSVLVGVGSTPIITFVANNGDEESFGTPTSVKLESYSEFAAKITVTPVVFDGINHVGENIRVRVKTLSNKTGDESNVPGAGFVFIKKPDKTVLGPFEMTNDVVGVYDYITSFDVDGEYYIRFQNVALDVLEEHKFVVRKSRTVI